jgi:hypothetical protein
MTTTLNNFTSETQLTASEATLLSTGPTEKKFIGALTLTNTSSSTVEVTLWRIASTATGTTGSGGNWIFRKTIGAGDTFKVQSMAGHVLGNSMKISGLADTASVINVDISGATET